MFKFNYLDDLIELFFGLSYAIFDAREINLARYNSFHN